MTPDDYQREAGRTSDVPRLMTLKRNGLDHPRLLHGALGVGTEAGELQDAVKRHLFYGTDIDRTHIIEECGDVLWYVAETLSAVGATMSEAMVANVAKLRARYPEGFSEERATGRDLGAERDAVEGRR